MHPTPRPSLSAQQDEHFVKPFEDDYLLSRELQILTDLGQRGAPVPRVLSTDYQARTITMAHAGSPLLDALAGLPPRRGERLAWLRSNGPKILSAVNTICGHGVYHLDLACRNFLVSQNAPVLIDFGLALCSRFPLQKPLWLIPSEKLHHPELVAALQADWEQFFLQSQQLRSHCAQHGLAFPPPLAVGLSLPGSAYSTYWPSRLQANALADPMALVAYNAGSLIEEIGDRLGLTGPDALAVDYLRHELQTLDGKTPAAQRLARAIVTLNDLGGTPRPTTTPKAASEPPTDGPQAASLETPVQKPEIVVSENANIKRQRFWPPGEGLHWLLRAASAGLTLGGFGLIDIAYRQTGAVLGDTGFVAALSASAPSLALVISLAFSRGLLAQRMLSLVLVALSLPFLTDLAQQGASLLQLGSPTIALVLGLALVIALPRDSRPPVA
jgi:hypothetical protein